MESGIISVDRWSQGSQAYFLTHLHADHTRGLTPTWKWGPLFCSRITAKLFPLKFPQFKLSLLRVLDLGHWYTLPLFSPSSGQPITVHVMAIDAHHCPGAVMYLFRGEFGCMLYTGDFRWERTSRRAQIARNMLLNALKQEKLDSLYLDNTYCNPLYSFPSREVAARQVVNIISSHPNHDIVIGVDSLGKEDLLHYVSQVLKIKIWVWPERLQTMHLLGFQDNFTTKTSLTRVRAIPRYSFSIETLEGLNMMRPTIGIMPSGLPWAKEIFKGKGSAFGPSPSHSVTCTNRKKPNGSLAGGQIYNQYIYTVPYSEHSCFAEIKEFVQLLQPASIKGIVASSPSYVEPLYYFGKFCGKKQESSMLYQKLWSEERVERVETIQIKSATKTTNSNLQGKKRRKKQVGLLVSHVNRVSLLRRLRRGIKITDTDFPAYEDNI
ncbi:uncharacterized protein [Coffea arabica]|uniref:Protein artemis n=1 Tax=Coffea arabica TaxID=13443 RepID=A0A6P6S4Z6_COFAR|nr:5' exonuclease Apollo-like isoform X1 [Coffea arabica]